MGEMPVDLCNEHPIFPSGAQIDLTSDEATAIEEFECTWRYQHFEASGVNF